MCPRTPTPTHTRLEAAGLPPHTCYGTWPGPGTDERMNGRVRTRMHRQDAPVGPDGRLPSWTGPPPSHLQPFPVSCSPSAPLSACGPSNVLGLTGHTPSSQGLAAGASI